jgi:protein-disulfide isomerase
MLSLLFIAAMVALMQEFRWRQSAGEAVTVAAVDNVPKDEFERRVHDYLLAHPEVVSEAIHRLEAQQRQQEAARGRAALKSHADQVFRDPADPVGGNPNGDATLVEFFDYNCPYCKQMAPVITQVLRCRPAVAHCLQRISDTGTRFGVCREGRACREQAGQIRRISPRALRTAWTG